LGGRVLGRPAGLGERAGHAVMPADLTLSNPSRAIISSFCCLLIALRGASSNFSEPLISYFFFMKA
jgi:hypothetical protein